MGIFNRETIPLGSKRWLFDGVTVGIDSPVERAALTIISASQSPGATRGLRRAGRAQAREMVFARTPKRLQGISIKMTVAQHTKTSQGDQNCATLARRVSAPPRVSRVHSVQWLNLLSPWRWTHHGNSAKFFTDQHQPNLEGQRTPGPTIRGTPAKTGLYRSLG
jgi:hypothetical protein